MLQNWNFYRRFELNVALQLFIALQLNVITIVEKNHNIVISINSIVLKIWKMNNKYCS